MDKPISEMTVEDLVGLICVIGFVIFMLVIAFKD